MVKPGVPRSTKNVVMRFFGPRGVSSTPVATNTITKCIQLLNDRDLLSCILENNKHSTSNIPNLAPIFFSYHLFFFTNLCLQDFKVTGTINELHEELILQAINELLYDK